MRITSIGAGYVGVPTIAVIAEKCPDIKVTIVYINAKSTADWNQEDHLQFLNPNQ